MSSLVKNFGIAEVIPIAGAGYATIRAFSEENKSARGRVDFALAGPALFATFMLVNSAFGDTKTFERDNADLSIKNANNVVDWIIVAALAFAGYRFLTETEDTVAGACAILAAVYYLFSVMWTKA